VDDEPLRHLPKVELHVHLEGSFDSDRIAELAEEAGEQLPGDPQSILRPRNLSELLERLDWWCGLVRAPEQAFRQAYDFAARLGADGVAYAEVIVNPSHWRGLRREALLEAVSAGFDQAARDGHCDAWLLVSLLRSQSAGEALEVVEALAAQPPSRLVGLSIDGNEAETGPTGKRFAPAFALAGALGLGRTAHAGESSGPEGIISALDDLGVRRIDHGVRCVEDPELMGRLATEGVALNVCLTSNVELLYGSIDRHPLAALVDGGLAVTINTDDPVTLGVTLTSEFALAQQVCRWGMRGAIAATDTAIRASFAPASRVSELRKRLSEFAAEARSERT
jgi:adenosine deaminase